MEDGQGGSLDAGVGRSVATGYPAADGVSDLQALASQVKQLAHGLGFDLVGIAPAVRSTRENFFRRWIDDGRAGEMTYLADRLDERLDPAKYLPGARAVVCVAMNYHVPLTDPHDLARATGRVARYALGDDYHELIKQKLYAIADWLRGAAPWAETRCGVDTAPINERELAARAGIGWVGKNTCVINERIGSWVFLGSVLTTLNLPIDEPATDRCGTCTRCIEACPTGAITDAYQLDARKCISYLTIEHHGPIDPSLQARMGDWIYGCDICQDVCPWNGKAPTATLPPLQPRWPDGRLPLDEVVGWTKEQFNTAFRRSAVKRISLPILQRNAAIAAGRAERDHGDGDSAT